MTTQNSSATTAWRTRPIFISSTFKDMHAERDWLRNRVFPRIEEKLRERRHYLEPIDLRLGVETAAAGTEEASELLVLKVCLDEIKRSRPFLLVLLGDRYGWVPDEERMAAAAREQGFETAVPGKSVTALEIEFGIFKEDPAQKHRSLFFFRKPLPYDQMPPETARQYSDACSPDARVQAGYSRLEALKKSLREDPELKPRVFDYSAGWDANNATVTGLDAFGDLVFEHLWAALEEETAAYLKQAPASWQMEEQAALGDFARERSRDFVGRGETIRQLLGLATGPAGETANWGACVVGPPGAGKSALFGELYHTLSADKNILLLANAAGGTQRGSQVESMLLRWIDELATSLGIANPLPEKHTPDDIDAALASLLHRASGAKRVVLLLDALNQFEPSIRGQHLTWLRDKPWPANARLIATALPGAPAQALCSRSGVEKIDLLPLTRADAVKIGERVWRRYHRKINPEILQVLLDKRVSDGTPAFGNPLWLTLALEQLNLLDADDFSRAERDFTGKPAQRLHALVMDTANRLPAAMDDLYGWLLAQNEKVYGPELVRPFSIAIALSCSGWRESDLIGLIPRLGACLFTAANTPAPDELKLAALRRGFRAHLTRRGAMETLDFAHSQMRQAIGRIWLSDENLLRTIHGRISDYLETLDPNDAINRYERMRHLIGEQDRLRAARYYAGLEDQDDPLAGERRGSGWTLVEYIRDGESALGSPADRAENNNLLWVVSWFEERAITQDEISRLANSFMFSIMERLGNEVSLPPRRILIENTRNALERLATADPTNADWQRDLSVSQNNVGDVLRNQGDLAGALAAYRESLIGFKRLATVDPTNAGWQRDLSVSQNKLGSVLLDQGDLAGALAAYRESLVVAERLATADPTNADWRCDLSVSQNKVGDVLLAQGDLAGALAAYRESLIGFKRLATADPMNAGWQRDLSVSQEKVGNVLLAQGDLAGALAEYREFIAVRQRLATADPTNAGWQFDLASAHCFGGIVLQEQGELTGALDAYRRYQEGMQRLATADPTNAGWQRDLGISHERIGSVLQAQGDLSGALTAFKHKQSIISRLATADPTNAGWQRDLAASCSNVGGIYKATGDVEKALDYYLRDLKIMEDLVAREPERADYQRDLSASCDYVGHIYEETGDGARALEYYMKELKIMETLVEREPNRADYQVDLVISYWNIFLICKKEDELYWLKKVHQILKTMKERGLVHGQLNQLLGLVEQELKKTVKRIKTKNIFNGHS